MAEEYQGSDNLIQENENPRAENAWPVRSLPPSTVAPPVQLTLLGASHGGAFTSDNRGNRPVEEEGAAAAKPYRCRFCQQTFPKSQGLGGHMNRHRQEKRAEQYDTALNLVHSRRRQEEQYENALNLVHSIRRHEEQYEHALNLLHSKRAPFQSEFHNIGSPSLVQPQFAGASALGSWSGPPLLQSQFTALPDQQEPYNHTPHPFRSNPVHPQGNLYADSDAELQFYTNLMKRQNSSQGWNRPDMVPTTGDDRNQDPQPRHQPQLVLRSDPNSGVGANMQRNYAASSFGRPDMVPTTGDDRNQDPQPRHQPQLVLRSDPNSGVGANMQRNYAASSFGQGMLSSSSSPAAVTEWEFSPRFQALLDNLRMGSSDQPGGLLSDSPARHIERALSDNFTLPPITSNHLANQRSYFPSSVSPLPMSLQELQNMQPLTYPSSQNRTLAINSIVNEDSRLPNIDGTLTGGLIPPSDPNSGVGATLQRNYPYSFGHGMPSSSSSPVAVTQGEFNPSTQRHNPTPLINSPVNEELGLANVSATPRGLTPPSQFQAATSINSQENINVVAGGSYSDNEDIYSDLELISSPYISSSDYSFLSYPE